MLNKPNITWLIYDSDSYMAYNNYTADGAYSSGDVLTKRIQIWNNHGGTVAIDDAKNARLIMAFKNYEDNFLLNLLKIKIIDNEEEIKPSIDIDRAIVDLGTIYGNALGDYIEIELIIGPIPKNLKSELKSLIFYIEYEQ